MRNIKKQKRWEAIFEKEKKGNLLKSFQMDNWWDHRSFWCIRVEEHLASLLGTGYLRPHAQGINNKLERTGCQLADGSSCFAFRRAADSILGFNLFADVYGIGAGAMVRAAGWRPHRFFSKIMSSKNESRDRTYAAIFSPKQIGMPRLLT